MQRSHFPANMKKYVNSDEDWYKWSGFDWWQPRLPANKSQTLLLLTVPVVHGQAMDPAASHALVRASIPTTRHIPTKFGKKVTCFVDVPGERCAFEFPAPKKEYANRLVVIHLSEPTPNLANFDYLGPFGHYEG